MADATPSVERVSALAAHYKPAAVESPGVTLSEIRNLALWQLAVWPDTLQSTAAKVAITLGVDTVPGFCAAASAGSVSMLRIEPCKFWIFGSDVASLDASEGAVLDLSHSRTHVRITGEKATTVLNSFLPLDLREQSFAKDAVASTAFHHVGVTLWRSAHGYELFIPRGFAVSLWELLCEASEQYGVAILDA